MTQLLEAGSRSADYFYAGSDHGSIYEKSKDGNSMAADVSSLFSLSITVFHVYNALDKQFIQLAGQMFTV